MPVFVVIIMGIGPGLTLSFKELRYAPEKKRFLKICSHKRNPVLRTQSKEILHHPHGGIGVPTCALASILASQTSSEVGLPVFFLQKR